MSAYIQTISYQVTIKRTIQAKDIDDAVDKGWANEPPPFTILPAPGTTVMYVATSAAANCDIPRLDNIEPASPDTLVPVELPLATAYAIQETTPADKTFAMYYGEHLVDFIQEWNDDGYQIWYYEDPDDTEGAMHDEFGASEGSTQPITVMLPANHPQAGA